MRYGIQLAVLAGAYITAAKLGLELGRPRSDHAGLGADRDRDRLLFLFGRRLWPAVAIGAFVANATSDASVGVSAAIAVGNTLEAVVGSEPPPRGGTARPRPRPRRARADRPRGDGGAGDRGDHRGHRPFLTDTVESYGSEWLLCGSATPWAP